MATPTVKRTRRSSVRTGPAIAVRYEALLRDWSGAQPDAWLHAAYEFGRDMNGCGLGVLEMAALHQAALVRVRAETSIEKMSAFIDASGRLLMESLASFEMTHRGFLPTNAALGVSEERYRELFENANDIIFTTDLSGAITSINQAGLALSNYAREEAVGVNVAAILAPQLLARVPESAIGDAATPTRYELDIVSRDGRRIPLEITTCMIVREGRPIGIQGIARDIADRRQAELALRQLNQWSEERASRIAHALHDEAGQLLASVYLRVAEIARELPTLQRQQMETLRELLDQVDDQIRRLAHELRPTLLDDLGLLPACEFLADGVSKRAMVKVSVHGSCGGRLPTDVETALYRVTQEALTNAGKHARSQTIRIEFERVDGLVRGRVRDDGAGFDVAAILAKVGNRGLGLMGMRERMVALGGTLAIRSSPGQGATIEFEVPVERA